MPKLTIEYADVTGENNPDGYFVRVFVDGEAIGNIQRLELRQTVGDPFPVFELDQVVYTQVARTQAEKLRGVPGLRYTALFVNHQGDIVSEKDAWFAEKNVEVATTGSWQRVLLPPVAGGDPRS